MDQQCIERGINCAPFGFLFWWMETPMVGEPLHTAHPQILRKNNCSNQRKYRISLSHFVRSTWLRFMFYINTDGIKVLQRTELPCRNCCQLPRFKITHIQYSLEDMFHYFTQKMFVIMSKSMFSNVFNLTLVYELR